MGLTHTVRWSVRSRRPASAGATEAAPWGASLTRPAIKTSSPSPSTHLSLCRVVSKAAEYGFGYAASCSASMTTNETVGDSRFTCLSALLFAMNNILCMPQRQPATMLLQIRHLMQRSEEHA